MNHIETIIDSSDEFDESYDNPSDLTVADVAGSVVYTMDWNVNTIVSQIDSDINDPDSSGCIYTSAPFQRRSVWNERAQSSFIESLMLGLPIPSLVLAESNDTPNLFYVLDGKQRLTALKQFMGQAENSLKLSNLEVLDSEIGGLKYSDIQASDSLRKFNQSLRAQPIRTIVVRNWKTPSLLHLIFSRLNKSGSPLTSHELRQALYPGEFTNWINEMSATRPGVQRARRLSEPDFRLRDAETLLRYLAFKSNVQAYSGNLRDFLDKMLDAGNRNFDKYKDDLDSAIDELDAAVEATFNIFGDRAFLRYDASRGAYLPRFNVGVFDLMTWYFSDNSLRESAMVTPERIQEAFEKLSTENANFSSYLTATTKTPTAVTGRIESWGRALGAALQREVSSNDYSLNLFRISPSRSGARKGRP